MGLPPGEFWGQTLGTFSIIACGIEQRADRRAQEARAHSYQVALLMRAKKLPDMQEWVTGKPDRAAYVRRWVEAWDKVDAGLNAARVN